MSEAIGEASRAWSWRHAIAKSGLPSTTRHVLLTLSLFMDEFGRGCFPSIVDLVDASGLAKSTVLTHLDGAKEAGWIEIAQHGYRGQRWRRQEYVAKWPSRDLVAEPLLAFADEEQNSTPGTGSANAEGGPAGEPPSDGGGGPADEQGGPADGPKVVRQDDQDKTSPQTTPLPVQAEREARARSGRTVKTFLLAWPSAGVDSRQKIEAAWGALTPEERDKALDHVEAYLAEFKRIGRGKLPAGWSYLGDRPWEIAEAKAAAAPPPTPAAKAGLAADEERLDPFSRRWWALWWRLRPISRDLTITAQSLARDGIGWRVKLDQAPTEEEAARLVAIPVRGDETNAWIKHLAEQRIFDLPLPDKAEWWFVPSRYPPDPARDHLLEEDELT